jgi:spore coat protein A
MKKEINVDRRTFVKMAGMAVGALTLGNYGLIRFGLAQQGTPIQGSSIPQFIEPLPLLNVAGGPIETIAGENNVEIHMREIKVNILPQGFIPNYAGTSVFAYLNGSGIPNTPKETYIGPVIVATRNNPIEAKFVNDLGDTGTTQVKAWKESTDRTLHWADPLNEGMVNGHYGDSGPAPIPACVHLHGGEIPPVLDGGPDAWFTSDGMYHGHGFYTKDGSNSNYSIYKYPNTQEASPIWFHDHVLGITRLNVYAGLAGAYVVVDPDMILPAGLDPLGLQRTGHTLDYLIPLVIQDRMFDTTGELYFPNIGLNPEHPYWIPELVGDTIVVNGKTWPFMNVEPRRYRFLIINGSNARPYELFLTNPVSKANGPAIYQIASDGGYLETPAIIDPNAPKGQLQRLRLMPGERADIIIDFAGLQGQTLIIRNTAKTPYPAGTATRQMEVK